MTEFFALLNMLILIAVPLVIIWLLFHLGSLLEDIKKELQEIKVYLRGEEPPATESNDD